MVILCRPFSLPHPGIRRDSLFLAAGIRVADRHEVGSLFSCQKHRRDQNGLNVPPVHAHPVLDGVDVAEGNTHGLTPGGESHRIPVEDLDARLRLCGQPGDGPSYIQDPAAGRARLEQRRERK
jgi:hypothetical protein